MAAISGGTGGVTAHRAARPSLASKPGPAAAYTQTVRGQYDRPAGVGRAAPVGRAGSWWPERRARFGPAAAVRTADGYDVVGHRRGTGVTQGTHAGADDKRVIEREIPGIAEGDARRPELRPGCRPAFC